MVFGLVVVVAVVAATPLAWPLAAGVAWAFAVGAVLCPVTLAGAAVAVAVALGFFAFAVVALCATANEPASSNTLIAKLPTNSISFLIRNLSSIRFVRSTPAQYTHPPASRRYNFRVKNLHKLRRYPACGTNNTFQSASADLNFMQSG
jgi:hypothetical protein